MPLADGATVTARGHVVRSGHILTVTRGEVFLVTGGEELSCSIMPETLMRTIGCPCSDAA